MARMMDDVADSEEIRRIALIGDKAELLPHRFLDFVWNVVVVALGGTLPGQPLQGLLRLLAIAPGFGGIVVLELVEAEADAAGKALGFGDGSGVLAEQARHFIGCLDMALGIWLEPASGIGNGAVLANAGDDILQHASAMLMVKHIIGGDQWRAMATAKIVQAIEPGAIGAAETARPADPDAARGMLCEHGKSSLGARPVRLVGHEDE